MSEEPAQGPLVTKTGKVLTDEDIQALADEAEAGYDVSHLKGEHTCNHRWHASRVEVETADVEHVCQLPKGHMDWDDGIGDLLEPPAQVDHRDSVHICSCGALTGRMTVR